MSEWIGIGSPAEGETVRYRDRLVSVLAVEGPTIVIRAPGLLNIVHVSQLQPMKSPDEIAAMEREKDIREMMRSSGGRLSLRRICESLYDAGYRKQEEDE